MLYDTVKQKKAFLGAFYDEKRRVVRDNINSGHSSRVSNLFAYAFGLLPDFDIDGFDVSKVNMFTAFPVMRRLLKDGKRSVLIAQLKNENAWLNMIKEGATTTFETWGKELKWNTSLFHVTLSYAAYFLTELFDENQKERG